MNKQFLLRSFVVVALLATNVNSTQGLIYLNFDEDIFTAPVGTPLIRITATLDLDGQHYLYGGTSHGSTTAVWADASFTLGPLPGATTTNDQLDSFKAQIGDLPGLVPPYEDVPVTIPIVWGYWHLNNWQFPQATDYPGYISATGSFESQSISDQYRVEFYVNMQPGYTADNPLLPDVVQPSGRYDFQLDMSATDLGQNFCVFIDPVAATGYHYSVDPGDPLFSVVYIPEALPLGDSEFDLEVAGATYPILAGVPFDLTQIAAEGVSEFTITGIDPAEGLDPADPSAFPTGLMFASPGVANVSMMPIPSPQTFVLLGAFALGSLMRRRHA